MRFNLREWLRFYICSGLVMASGVGFSQRLSFAPGVNYPVGEEPQQVAIGDLNGDGIPDITVTNFASNTVSIYLGRGNGTFVAGSPVTAPTPQWIVIADLNGDGIPDLAVTPGFSPFVTLLFGKGDGTFHSPVTVAAGENANGIAVGDLNGDGKPDLVVANSVFGSGYITILINKGDGTFRQPIHVAAGYDPILVAIADFDSCGLPDIAVANLGLESPGMEGSVAIVHNRGDGTFEAPKFYAAGNSPEALVVGDFNRDGRLDIAVAANQSGNQGSVAVLLADYHGGFEPPRFYAAGLSPFKLAVADFNDDGNPDLAVADNGNGKFAVLLGNGDGSFQPPRYLQGTVTATGVSAGDLNGDGKPDIVGVDFDLLEITVFINTTK